MCPHESQAFYCSIESCVTSTVYVLQEFWEVEELRDELFHVGWALHTSLPRCCYRVELSVRAVKPAHTHTTGDETKCIRGLQKKLLLQNAYS